MQAFCGVDHKYPLVAYILCSETSMLLYSLYQPPGFHVLPQFSV